MDKQYHIGPLEDVLEYEELQLWPGCRCDVTQNLHQCSFLAVLHQRHKRSPSHHSALRYRCNVDDFEIRKAVCNTFG